ncbi:MAG: HAMP domain-containing sensor histidine kinase [Campylobacterota bacterium]|nr:HAMP domain-containing sensor histidine kinase [Campylobacterota bacterium]
MTTNKILKRQLKKAGIDNSEAPTKESFEKLLALVEQSYQDSDDTRRMMEYSLDIFSQEMREAVDELEFAHKEVEKKDKLMFQQSRFAQMGEMISMIAHQWRQPLNFIGTTTAAIQFDVFFDKLDKDELIKHTDNISHQSQYLSDTIDDFRNFFRSDKGVEIITYSDLVCSVLNIIGASIEYKKIKIIKDLSCICKFSTYSNELKHVVINILKNAEDVLTENKIENPYISIKTYKENENSVLEISDNAGGIPEEIIEKIFDPYFSTKSKKNGTGLGLYMSKIIVEDHCGGLLQVSNSDEGAVFKIILKS